MRALEDSADRTPWKLGFSMDFQWIFNGFSMVITDEDVKIWLGLWSMHSDNAYSLYIAYSYIPVFFGGWLARWEFLAE